MYKSLFELGKGWWAASMTASGGDLLAEVYSRGELAADQGGVVHDLPFLRLGPPRATRCPQSDIGEV